MNRHYFGTDGVRGPYGGPIVNEAFAARLGAAAGSWLANVGHPAGVAADLRSERSASSHPGGVAYTSSLVLIGRDSRASGETLAGALAAGLSARGWEPRSLGVLPTPAAAQAVRTAGAALGAMITASHNPAADNGIKFFRGGGGKLTDEQEAAIEGFLPAEGSVFAAVRDWPGSGETARSAVADYIETAGRLLPAGALRGWRLVLDTANGATCETSPAVLRGLGAEVFGLGAAPNGRNINEGVGSEHPAAMQARVLGERARLGIAHDGDGDRCVLCDETGRLLDGDEVMTLLAVHALAQNRLAERTLVVTVHSNLGVDAAIAAAGGKVIRAAVGDRHVAECMAASGATLGGESSGHFIFSDHACTGDGLVAALKVIEVMIATGRPLSELRRVLKKFPQASTAVVVQEKRPVTEMKRLTDVIRDLEAELGSRGRVLVRYSGTEPKLRLLVEGPEQTMVQGGLERLVAAVNADFGV